jgi:signal transduction histidine kinase
LATVAGAALIVIAGAILLKAGDEATRKAIDDWASPCFYAVAGGTGLVAARRQQGRPRLAFVLVAACCFLLGIGDAIWAYDETVLRHPSPFPSTADVAYLASTPLAITGIALLPSAPSRPTARVRAVLDGSLIAGSLLLLSWVTTLGAVYHASKGGALERTISLAYPLSDIVTVALILFVVGRVSGPARRSMVMLGLGFLLTSTSDSVYAYLTAIKGYATGDVIDIGWMAGAYLISVGLLTVPRGPLAAELTWNPSGRLGSILPYLAAIFAIGLAGVQDYRARLDVFGLLIAAAIIFVVLARQMLTLVENSRLLIQSEEANRLKSRFLAITSHELRTPLAVIVGYSDLLLQGVDRDLTPSQAECIREIQESGDGLVRIIDDLLDISKIEAGQMRLDVRTHDLSKLIVDVTSTLRPMVLKKGLELMVDAGEGLPAVCDAARARQVLTNLIGNAVKFTRTGSIRVTCLIHEGMAEVAVEDTGVGIPPHELSRVFDEFRRLEGTRESADGTGLGLTISQRLVELQLGKIGVSSEPAVGSRFWFTLPLANDHTIEVRGT